MTPTIVVAGSLNMDFVVVVDRLPSPGQTVLGSGFQTLPGGKGANQACAAGRLGGVSSRTKMIGRVGADHFGQQLKDSLAAAGVDVEQVQASAAAPTGVALIWVEASGQNSIVVAAGANQLLSAADLDAARASFRGARAALFQLESPLEAVAAGLRAARDEGALTILDPAPAQPLGAEILSLVDILTPNESEACQLAGEPPRRLDGGEARAMAERLLALGPRGVVLKLGDRGCYFLGGGIEETCAAFPVDAVDATAAGDTFNGALAVALAEGKAWPAALRFACAASAISVTRMGAQTSIPTREETDEFLAARC